MPRHRKHYWSSSDTRTLKAKAGKMPINLIAKMLGRTEGAARQKAWSLGLSVDSR